MFGRELWRTLLAASVLAVAAGCAHSTPDADYLIPQTTPVELTPSPDDFHPCILGTGNTIAVEGFGKFPLDFQPWPDGDKVILGNPDVVVYEIKRLPDGSLDVEVLKKAPDVTPFFTDFNDPGITTDIVDGDGNPVGTLQIAAFGYIDTETDKQPFIDGIFSSVDCVGSDSEGKPYDDAIAYSPLLEPRPTPENEG